MNEILLNNNIYLVFILFCLIIFSLYKIFDYILNGIEFNNFKDFIKRSLLKNKLKEKYVDDFISKIHFDDRGIKVPYVSLREYYFPKSYSYSIDLIKVYMLFFTNLYYKNKCDIYENKDFVDRYSYLINEYKTEFFNDNGGLNSSKEELYVFIKLGINMIEYYDELNNYEKNLFGLKN